MSYRDEDTDALEHLGERQGEIQLIPISDKEFMKIAKGSGIKYRNKIPLKDLKAMLGYCPLTQTKIKIEIKNENGERKIYNSIAQAARESECISSAAAIRYALKTGRNYELFTNFALAFLFSPNPRGVVLSLSGVPYVTRLSLTFIS